MRLFLICFALMAAFVSAENCARYKVFAGPGSEELASKVSDYLGIPLSHASTTRFSDGEIRIKIEENVRNYHTFIVQSTCSSAYDNVNDSVIELYLLIRTLKRSSASKVTAIIPYYGYARQDRKTESRVPISASDIAMLLETAGADHIISLDLHCGQIQGFFHQAPVDNLSAVPIFARYFAGKTDLVNPVIVSPDAGGVERAKSFVEGFESLGIPSKLAIIIKQRPAPGVVDKMNLVGSVEGCDAIIVDDLCDTAGTLVKAALELKKQGALRVFACISHPVFSGPALERIANSCLTELVVTDTIPLYKEIPPNIVQLSIAPLIAKAIDRIADGNSLSYLFNTANWEEVGL